MKKIGITFRENLKQAAKNSSHPPSRIRQELYSKLTPDEAFFVPNSSASRQTINRVRRKNSLPQPATIHEFEVQEEYKDFVLADVSDGDGNRVIILCQRKHLKLLADSKELMMDGTFSTVSLFYQLYTIFGQSCPESAPHHLVPVVYCLMSSKSSDCYRLLFETLIEVMESENLNLDPERILIDFEEAVIKVIRDVSLFLIQNLKLNFFNFFFLIFRYFH